MELLIVRGVEPTSYEVGKFHQQNLPASSITGYSFSGEHGVKPTQSNRNPLGHKSQGPSIDSREIDSTQIIMRSKLPSTISGWNML